MKLKRQHWIGIAVVGLFAVIAVLLVTSDPPGTKKQTGDVLTMTFGGTNAGATAVFDITLQEGGDAAHEAEHVFKSIESPSIASASFNVTSLKLEVRYDESAISEADLRKMLASSGYVRVSAADAAPAQLSADGKSQTLVVKVGQALEPNLMRAKAGVPLTISFSQGGGHLASVTIAGLGVKADLAAGPTTVEVKDPMPGTYDIICAEGASDGTLFVE